MKSYKTPYHPKLFCFWRKLSSTIFLGDERDTVRWAFYYAITTYGLRKAIKIRATPNCRIRSGLSFDKNTLFQLKVLQNTELTWGRHGFKVKLKSHTTFSNLKGLSWKLQYKSFSIERFSFIHSSRFNKIMRKVSSMKRAKFNFRNHTVNDC